MPVRVSKGEIISEFGRLSVVVIVLLMVTLVVDEIVVGLVVVVCVKLRSSL